MRGRHKKSCDCEKCKAKKLGGQNEGTKTRL